MKVIFHLDLDSYFVGAHRTVDPTLIGKPVVVSTRQRRSIVAAASYEAKKLGVYTPMPFYKAQELVPDLIAVEPNYALYTVLSSKMFEYISSKYTKNIEVASIDECYIDVTDIWRKYGSPYKLAELIQNDIKKELKLDCSIGVSNNKFVAKMSTQVNKPFGITITKPGEFLKEFGSWPLEKFHGIGLPTANKLKKLNINTIEELAHAKEKDVHSVVGSMAKGLIWRANGNGQDELDLSHNDLKSIGNSVTFQDKDRNNRQEILGILSSLVNTVSIRAKNRNQVGSVITLVIKDKGGLQAKMHRRQVTLPKPINSYDEIFQEATKIFDTIWEEQTIKFVGVTLSKLSNMFDTTYQTSIFDEEQKKTKVEELVDKINYQFKSKVLTTGKEYKHVVIKKKNQSRYIESERIIKHYADEYKK